MEDTPSEKFRTFEDLEVYKAVDDLNICSDESYLSNDEVAKLKNQPNGVLILINGYLRYLRTRSSSVRETDEEGVWPLNELLEPVPL